MSKENVQNELFDANGLNVTCIKSVSKRGGRKKGSKNKKRTVDYYAEEYLKNPTEENFQQLWLRSIWGLKQHAYKILQDEMDVDDAISNVFEKVFQKKEQYNPEKGKFSTWLYKICFNESLQIKERHKKDNFVDNDYEELFPSYQGYTDNNDLFDDFDYSDKFETVDYCTVEMIDKETIKKRFFDTSINIIKSFEDERICNCMMERFNFFSENNKRIRPLTFKEIAEKYNYPITSVNNWVIKGKLELKEKMINLYPDLYEMWKETLS